MQNSTRILDARLLLPGCLLGAALAPISCRLLDKFGAQRPILLGNCSILISVICYSLYPGELSSLLFIIFYLFFAFGQGFSMGTIMTNGLSQLPEKLNADGNAAYFMWMFYASVFRWLFSFFII